MFPGGIGGLIFDNPNKCARCKEDRKEHWVWKHGPKGSRYAGVTVCTLCGIALEQEKRNAAGFEPKLPKEKRNRYKR